MADSISDKSVWPEALGRLVVGDDLPAALLEAAFSQVLAGTATDAQIAGLALGLRAKGESVLELATLVRTALSFSDPLEIVSDSPLVDTCGTGGEGFGGRAGTANVSTMAAIIAAGAGAPVVKHGNRAVSSSSGSADVLEALGVVIDLGPEGVARCVAEARIGFCFAPRFHGAFRFAAAARREMGVPTTFNLLGPLANPARVKHQALGVADATMAERMLETLAELGSIHVLVFFGHDGLDELTTTAPSTVFELKAGKTNSYEIDAQTFGLSRATINDLAGGDPATNAKIIQQVLAGESGPARDIAVLNAAAALVAADHADDLAQGVAQAIAAVDSGAAAAVLNQWIVVSGAARQDGC